MSHQFVIVDAIPWNNVCICSVFRLH